MKSSPMFLALALAVGSGSVLTAEAAAQSSERSVRATAQAGMLLTGSVDISATGTVDGYRLDHEEKIPAYVLDYLRPIISGWRFEPAKVDGKAVAAVSPMNLRLTGREAGEGNLQLVLENAGFRTYDPKDPTELASIRLAPPAYPAEAFATNGSGEVMLLVKINREGTVDEVATERVDLTVAGNERMMQRMRDVLSKASVNAARRWTFRIPSEGPSKDDANWTVRIPVSFALSDSGSRKDDRYGKWNAYIPGPRQQAPWHVPNIHGESSADLLPDQGVFLAGVRKGPQLLTPVGG